MISKYTNAIRYSAVAIALITLFPPWNAFDRGHLVETVGYSFLFTPPETSAGVAQINITTLVVECFVALAIIWGLALGTKNSHGSNNLLASNGSEVQSRTVESADVSTSDMSKSSIASTAPNAFAYSYLVEKNTSPSRTYHKVFEPSFLKQVVEDRRYFSILVLGLVVIAALIVGRRIFQPTPELKPVAGAPVAEAVVSEVKPLTESPPIQRPPQVSPETLDATKKRLAEMLAKHLKEVAQQEQIQKQIEIRRARQFQPKTWRLLKTPISGVSAHLQTTLDAHEGVYYKFWLTGNPELIEMAKGYYSGYSVQLLNRQGYKVAAFSAYQSDLTSFQKGNSMSLLAKGNIPLLEEEYSKITQ